MRLLTPILVPLAMVSCRTRDTGAPGEGVPRRDVERIVLAPEGRGFVTARSRRPFLPWGMNYGNEGRLLEDFWEDEWDTLAGDLRELTALGANVVRVHLQFGAFMETEDRPDGEALDRLARLLQLAADTGIHLDLTGLGCYRPGDVPAWYDALDEPARWAVQATFWKAVARVCAGDPVVFCYDLMNEPVAPAGRRDPGQWSSGRLFGGYDFVQFIALDPAGRERADIAVAWIRRMTEAIREHDRQTLVTVGLLPWSRRWRHLSGFVPEKVAPELDFLSVHVYPDRERPGEALECLRQFAVGVPLVVEETFPLRCGIAELERFLRASREYACGWMGHYDGTPPGELDRLERAGGLTIAQAIRRDWLRLFARLGPEFAPGR